MAVAKSFVDFPIVKDVYEKNGRKYVDVKNPKTAALPPASIATSATTAPNAALTA